MIVHSCTISPIGRPLAPKVIGSAAARPWLHRDSFRTPRFAIVERPRAGLDDARLRQLQRAARHTTVEEFEVEDNFPKIGRRTMLLNARKVFYEGSNSTSLLVAIEDVTERRALEREKDEFLRRKTSCCGRRICCSGR